MSHPLIHTWGTNEKLTSAQMNTVAQNLRDSVDKVGGDTVTGPLILDDVTISGTARVKLASRSITRIHRIPPFYDSSEWNFDTSVRHSWVTTTSTTFRQIYFPIDVPNGCTITRYSAFLRPPSGHSGSLPTTMPTVSLRSYDPSSGTDSNLSLTTDSASAGTYENRREVASVTVSLGPLDKSIRWYSIRVVTEDTISLDFQVFAVSTTFTVTDMDDG